MKIAFSAALSILGIVLTTGCQADSSNDAQPAPSMSTVTGTASPDAAAAAEAPLELTDGQRGKICLQQSPDVDLAWFNTQWKANEELDSFEFSLVGARGVRMVGTPITVPPVNFGGRIDYSGAVSWDTRSDLAKERVISWWQRDNTLFWTPIKDESGLLVLHLRFSQHKAYIGGVKATYVTHKGEKGSVQATAHEKYFVGGRCPF